MPAKFAFRLEPLLDWRLRIEEEKRRDVAALRRIERECTRELEALRAARRHCGAALAESAGRRPPADLRLRDAYLCALDDAIGRELCRRDDLRATVRRALDELIAARRDRRVIEELKKRRRREFDAREERLDELELDEANTRRHERDARERLARRQAERAVG